MDDTNKTNLEEYVDSLWGEDDDTHHNTPQQAPGNAAGMGNIGQNPGLMGRQAPMPMGGGMAPVPGPNSYNTMARPSNPQITILPHALRQGQHMGQAPGGPIGRAQPREQAAPGGSVIPPNLLSNTVQARGFATNMLTGAPHMEQGGLAGMSTKISPNPQHSINPGKLVTVAPSVRIAGAHGSSHSTAPLTYIPGSTATSTGLAAMTLPNSSGAPVAPRMAHQPVSAKAASANMEKPVPATAPAAKKQMLSDGSARGRNADGSVMNDNDDGDADMVITKADRESAHVDPTYGKSKLTAEEARREMSKDESRKIVNLRVVKAKSDAVCVANHMKAAPKVAEAIALGLQRRLEDALSAMVEISRSRLDLDGDTSSSMVVRSSNARLYLQEQENKRQLEREKRIAAARKAHTGAEVKDPSAASREEEISRVLLKGVGGARPRPMMDIDSIASATAPGTSSSITSSAIPYAAPTVPIKEQSRRVTLQDALTFLRQDFHSKHSTLALHSFAGIRPPEPPSITVSELHAAGHSLAAAASASNYASGHHPTIMTRSAAASSSAPSPTPHHHVASSSQYAAAPHTQPGSATAIMMSTTTPTATTLRHPTPTSSAGAPAPRNAPSPRPTPATTPINSQPSASGLTSFQPSASSSVAANRPTRHAAPSQKR